MMNHYRPKRLNQQPGQALVETALAVAIMSFLFLAAVDLGSAYRSYQSLINATAETASYISQFPVDSSGSTTNADAAARNNFRSEQGNTRTLSGTSSIVNADIEIIEADSSQIELKVDTGDFAVVSINDFARTGVKACQDRHRFDTSGKQCFIVVRSKTTYRPFFLSPALGDTMTIRAIAVKPLVGLP